MYRKIFLSGTQKFLYNQKIDRRMTGRVPIVRTGEGNSDKGVFTGSSWSPLISEDRKDVSPSIQKQKTLPVGRVKINKSLRMYKNKDL